MPQGMSFSAFMGVNVKNISIDLGEPNPRQKLFLMDKHKYIAFGGARGGGKSWSVRTKAILLSLNFPGIKILIMRKTYPELKANHIDQLRGMIGSAAVYNATEKEFKFLNGSRIILRSAQNDKETDKIQGTEADVIFIDEATHFTKEQFDKITACLRGVNAFPKRIYLTCNPGGPGHTWVKRLFIDRKYNATEDPEDYSFLKSLVQDNKALLTQDPDYIKQLEALPPKLRKAWLEGDWNIFEGQFFSEFREQPYAGDLEEAGISEAEAIRQRRFTHVIDDFEVPRDWTIYRSFDFGFSKPFSCDWWAIDYEGRAYLIHQFYGCSGQANEGMKLEPHRLFDEIHSIEMSHKWLRGKSIQGVADPAIWDASHGESIADVADKHFVHFVPGDNSRIAGWMQCHYRLAFDEEGYPMVYFFRSCEHAIRTLPLLQYSETKPEDLDTTQEDHFADSFRYFAMERPITPQHKAMPKEYRDDPLDLRKDRWGY